jgi:hypothetical protein
MFRKRISVVIQINGNYCLVDKLCGTEEMWIEQLSVHVCCGSGFGTKFSKKPGIQAIYLGQDPDRDVFESQIRIRASTVQIRNIGLICDYLVYTRLRCG